MLFAYGFGMYHNASDRADETPIFKKSAVGAGRIQEQTRRLEFALLVQEAMWSILRDHINVTDEDLVLRISELDVVDDHSEQQNRKRVVACPKCYRTISPRVSRCMYCGQPVMKDPFA